MELRPGYKQTELGVIPEDWDVVQLGELRPFVTSGSRGWASFYSEDGNLFVRITNLSRDSIYLDLTACKFVRLPAEATEGIRTKLAERDVLISITADIGIVGYVDASVPLPAYINQHIALVRFDPSKVSAQFVAYFLASEYPQRLFRSSTDTGAKAGMSLGTVQRIQTAFPLLPEQRAIAAALSDVDGLLEALTRLIAKKRALKQAAMQQLLTGEKRLPGHEGAWEQVPLGDLFDFKNGLNKSKEFFGHGTPIVNYMDVFSRSDMRFGEISGRVSLNKIELKTFDVRKGDVFFTRTSETSEEVGIASVMLDEPVKTVFSGFVLRARPINDRLSDGFKAHCFRSSYVRRQIISKASYTTRALTNGRILSEVLLPLPNLPEQTAIAAVLSDMDAELAALEARRDKTRALKQAMMQDLLTGRTRLVAPVVTESREDSERTDGRQANIHFKRSVLAAEIIDRLHNEPTFGHVKFEKMIYLVEHLCDVDTGSTYHRDAAGPYDNRGIRSIDSQLRKQKWFDAQKIDGRYQYEPLANHGKHSEYFDRYYAAIGTTFDTVIETFRGFTTERCEIVATLFGAWRDLLQQNDPVSDDAIVNEVLNNWHKSKKRIPEEKWRKALSWMRDRGFVPRKAMGA